MSEYSKGLLIGLTILCCFHASGDSIFFVDGLAVDSLKSSEESPTEEAFFSAKLQRFPLVDRKRPFGLFQLSLAGQRPKSQQTSPLWGSDRGMRHMKRAQMFVDSGSWERARVEIEKALTYTPDNAYLLRRAAALSAIARKYGVADGYFQRCLAMDPENVPFLIGYAGVLLRLQRFDEAQQLVDRALAIEPNYLAALFNQAFLHVLQGDVGAMEDNWSEQNLQGILQLAGWLDADRDEFIKILSKEGFQLLCRMIIGENSDQHLKEIVEQTGRALSSIADKHYEYAVPPLQRLSSFELHSFWPDLTLAESYYRIGRETESGALLARTARKHPESIYVWFNIGVIQVQAEKYDNAIKAFMKVVDLSPDYRQGKFALACAYAGKGEMETAWPILVDLSAWNSDTLKRWMEGDKHYLQVIRNDPRYLTLFGLSPEQ